MSGLNDVKAGKYQLVALSWDQITSKPGEPLNKTRYHRGEVVDLNVEDARRLVAAGAVVEPGSLERSRLEQAKALAEQAQRAYEAALSGLPDEARAEVAPGTVSSDGTGEDGDGEFDPTVGGNVKPTLAWVGEDQARAQQMLDLEDARDGGPRSSLVDKLNAIVAGS